MARPTRGCFAPVGLAVLLLFAGASSRIRSADAGAVGDEPAGDAPAAAEPAGAEESTRFTADDLRFFEASVRPLLASNCLSCHGGVSESGKVRVRGGLRLTGRALALRGGDQGPAVVPGSPEKSLLLDMISYRDDEHQMPPRGKLPDTEIAILTEWVKRGVPWTPGEDAETPPLEHETRDLDSELRAARSYFAYRPLERPDVPSVATPGFDAHPIDAFIAHGVETAGLKPNPEASRAVLVRRAYQDIVGLPPDPDAVRRFVESDDPRAWEALVDELLASPHFGEKWARHWLDVVRYAESNGYERDSDKEHMWRYRDYVIRAFNDDKPYDRFILEQLAGDELDVVTADSIVATGFYRLHIWDDEPADRPQARYDNLDDILRTTTEAFLGSTLGCARCHDHKADPFTQRDYYSFLSFFDNITPMGKNTGDRGLYRPLGELARNDGAATEIEALESRSASCRARIGEIERLALERVTAGGGTLVDPAFEPGSDLLASSSDTGRFVFTTGTPPSGWETNGFSAEGFDEVALPFGPDGGAGWRGGPKLHLRGEFRLTAIPMAVDLSLLARGPVRVWLNGQLVLEREKTEELETIPLDRTARSALQTGKNILAIEARRRGPPDLDVRLTVGKEIALADLVEIRGESLFGGPELVAEHRQLEAEAAALTARLRDLRGEGLALCVAENGRSAPQTFVHIRGSVHARGDDVEPAFPPALTSARPRIRELPEGVNSTGRRRALAEWIASPENGIAARVAVNRIWQHYLGRGIVASANDYGRLGEPPTHPELLDWLAVELVANGWRQKAIHRAILLSKTYRMSSRASAEALARDPANQLFWRHEMRRLGAEEIRDAMLVAAGDLNRDLHGPSVYPQLPPEVLATSSTGAGKWGRSSPEDERRRSVYIKVKRSLLPPALTDFDFADTDNSCAVRFASTVPTQALGLLNSRDVNEVADRFAARLRRERPGSLDAQVRRGIEIATCRPARDEEAQRALDLIAELRDSTGLQEEDALARFALVLLNLNEFLYLD